MSVDIRLMTADELLAMPKDGMQHELVNGELITMVPAGYRHGTVGGDIHGHLWNYVRAQRLGKVTTSETGYILSRNPDTVRCPDVAFVRTERDVDERGLFAGAPDLAVEVMSPNDRFSDVVAKVAEYLRAGTSVVIVVDPQKQVAWSYSESEQRTFTICDALEAPDVLPGWSLPLRELFA
jgi:Uma2 family endonuclease